MIKFWSCYITNFDHVYYLIIIITWCLIFTCTCISQDGVLLEAVFFFKYQQLREGTNIRRDGSLGWGGKVCRIDKSRNYTWCKESTASYFCWLLLESLLASAACFLASNSSLLRTYQVGQIYCYKTWRQITPEMFIALQGKSQFKIKVIQIVVCGMLTCHMSSHWFMVILQIDISEIFQVFKVSKRHTVHVKKCHLIISCDFWV